MSTTNPTDIETEWDTLQRKYGNLPAKEKQITEEEVTQRNVEALEGFDFTRNKNLGEVDRELEDVQDDDEEKLLLELRRKRIEELKNKQNRNKFGSLYHLAKDEFVTEVTRASEKNFETGGGSAPAPAGHSSVMRPGAASDSDEEEDDGRAAGKDGGTWVVVHLYKESVDTCILLNRVLEKMAQKYSMVKFLKGISSDVIRDYPDKKLPTVLLYFGGTCRQQIIGAAEWGGVQLNFQTVEYKLGHKYKVFEVECDSKDASNLKARPGRGGDNSDSDDEQRRIRDRGYTSVKLDKIMGKYA